MLDAIDLEDCQRVIDSVPCLVEVPSAYADLLQEEGYAAPSPMEERKYARYRFCRPAALQIIEDLPLLPRMRKIGGSYLVSISIGGAAVLFDEQLYPREQVRIWIAADALTGTVARCRRIGPKCYEVGIILDERVQVHRITRGH